MFSFVHIVKSGFQHALKLFQKHSFVSRQNLPASVDFILVDMEEEETESLLEIYTNSASSMETRSSYTEIQPPPILHPDELPSAICPSGNFLDLRATYPSLSLPVGVFIGPEICINASFKGYVTTLLAPCIWLVLGSYVFVATLTWIFCKLKTRSLVLSDSENDGYKQATQEHIPNVSISTTTPPTPEAVLENTFKQYGHIADDVVIFEPAQCSPSNRKQELPTLRHETLRNTINGAMNTKLRSIIPDSRITKGRCYQETRFPFPVSLTHTVAMNVQTMQSNRSIVHAPARTQEDIVVIKTGDVRKRIVSLPVRANFGTKPSILYQTTQMPAPRPAPIIPDSRHLAPLEHRCFSSSPLKSSYTASPPNSPDLWTPIPILPATPVNGLKKRAYGRPPKID
ncbi:hypothetical protein RSOLAG1IB_02142 [Rhizoctonia solani AG-1 IB]|uniref:Uncharacterized protein n=1 Tax=Thanatephorus cucumeris (strain AG1-IB / isolate 7/3/14) TaxID=1108050 RepID=A0A0B7FME4_THACB|nr:hypothetical protein RSOLAG1IB_02142 [Rhizoctonia solani AG-1 IB]